jgi:hypothetical protein
MAAGFRRFFMNEYEQLGAFYLGRVFDPHSNKVTDDLLLYDAKDLTTHAVCVGMTGSGKTGLCLSLLEEAAIDGVPALVIDPKGDLGNLLLAFPDLKAGDFRPWIDEGEAARKGLSADEYAEQTAQTWRKGLADWGQDGSRIARYRESVDLAIYTPGSSAGLSISVLRSLAAPPATLLEDADAVRERILATVSGLLALLGVDADPIRSREHILLSNILDSVWREGRSLEIADLVHAIQQPPFERVGVLDLETFYPARDRMELVLHLNNLLASPGFAAWMEGEPLDIPRLLWTVDGQPRLSVLSIAHLSDAERMFFVTLLLNEVVAWMRTQPGTSSLRAIVYMDEVFGYFPPTANPPSKTPMLTLLKQARAFGVGIVLATQNPVDLDYKGLSNAGTWFLGRLQTERDKARVLDGLEGASAAQGTGFDRKRIDGILSGLGKRVFLMNNVHDAAPTMFQTRWAMSYLRGPLTRVQIQTLMAERRRQQPIGDAAQRQPQAVIADTPASPAAVPAAAGSVRAVLPHGVTERFWRADGGQPRYRPALFGTAQLHYVDARRGIDHWQPATWLAPLPDDSGADPWEGAEALAATPSFDPEPASQAQFLALPAQAARAASYVRWGKQLASRLYRDGTLTLSTVPELKLASRPGESEAEFRIRAGQLAREQRDQDVEKLRAKYAPKLQRLNERIRTAEGRVDREKSQYRQQQLQTGISIGATVLGALLGRKAVSAGSVGRATTAARGAGRAAQRKQAVGRAADSVEALREQLAALEQEFETEIHRLGEGHHPDRLQLQPLRLAPRKSDLSVGPVELVWIPEGVRPE